MSDERNISFRRTKPKREATMNLLDHPFRWLKHIRSIVTIAFLALLAAGCSNPPPTDVTVLGSNTFGEELAPRLMAEFKKQHPTTEFKAEFKGTPYGIGALMVDRCDIAAASRDLSKTELELAKDRNIDFNEYKIGYYSVAVAVNADNPVAKLTADQVRDIFTGAVHNWSEVGGPDAAIHLYIRDPISGTHLGFQELAMDKKPYAEGFKTFNNYGQIVNAVMQDSHGIGYVSIEDAAKTGIKAVTIGDVAPTFEAVNKGQYPYARLVRLYTTKAGEKPAAREFIDFVQSPAGQKILVEMGFVPKS